MANWLKMYNIGENNFSHKCLLRICLIRASIFEILSRLYNIGYASAKTATSNIINRLIYKIAIKNLV